MNESDPRSDVHYLGSSENKAWKKNSGLYGIWIHDLCDTGAALYQLGYVNKTVKTLFFSVIRNFLERV